MVYLLGNFLHWQTLAMLVVPLPILALVYGYFIPESPIFLSQVEIQLNLFDGKLQFTTRAANRLIGEVVRRRTLLGPSPG